MKAAIIFLADFLDGAFEFPCRPESELVLAHVGHHAFTEPVGLVDMVNIGDRQAALAVHGIHAAERGAGHGRAVIGVLAADHHLLARLSLQRPVAAYQAKDRIVGLGAGTGIEDHVDMFRRQIAEHLRQFDHWRMRGLEERIVIGKLAHLRADGFDDFLPAVTDIDAPQAGHAVHDAVSVRIPKPDTIGTGDDPPLIDSQCAMLGKWMKVVLVVGNLEIVRRHVDAHYFCS
jgi:hypothetical protein